MPVNKQKIIKFFDTSAPTLNAGTKTRQNQPPITLNNHFPRLDSKGIAKPSFTQRPPPKTTFPQAELNSLTNINDINRALQDQIELLRQSEARKQNFIIDKYDIV